MSFYDKVGLVGVGKFIAAGSDGRYTLVADDSSSVQS